MGKIAETKLMTATVVAQNQSGANGSKGMT